MNNPADKMLQVALQLKEPRYNKTKVRDIWREVLNMENSSTSDLYREIADVIDFPEAIRYALNNIGYPVETLEPPLKRLDNLFATLEFGSSGNVFSQQINNDVIRSLEQAKWIIDNPNFSNFSKGEMSTLNELLDELKSLFDRISDIDSVETELREFLDIYIAQLISGIEEYLKTNDINSLKFAATSALSVLGLESSILDSSKRTDEGLAFREALLKILTFIGYGNELKQFADNVGLLN